MSSFSVGDRVFVKSVSGTTGATVYEGEARVFEVLGPEMVAVEFYGRTRFVYTDGTDGDEIRLWDARAAELAPVAPVIELSTSQQRKNLPVCSGVLDYFPDALLAVARLSKAGNDKHNPGEPLHHARGKSMDHADCLVRHLMDRGRLDPDTGLSHSVAVAWRALALLQEELEAAGAPMARGAKK
jgi:hypothetical protein